MNLMKTLAVCALSLFFGLLLGGYLGHRYAVHRRAQRADQATQAGEKTDRENAARAIRAIELIGAGERQEAVQLLAKPIAHYYYMYGKSAESGPRQRLAGMIEQLLRTNSLVAAEMTNAMPNFQIPGQGP
jgi:hypothetical protein